MMKANIEIMLAIGMNAEKVGDTCDNSTDMIVVDFRDD